MRLRSVVFVVLLFVGVAALVVGAAAQASSGAAQPARGAGAAQQPAGRGAAPPAGRGAAPAAGGTQLHGNLLQVMRGILLPNSNVVFFAQAEDPAAVKQEEPAATAVNPLASIYGGWQAVENSSIAMAEAANLLTIPGRRCSNGRPVPIDAADWKMFVQELRDAGMASLKAAQAKNQDQILDAAEKVTMACGNCHDVYREKEGPGQGGLAARCTK